MLRTAIITALLVAFGLPVFAAPLQEDRPRELAYSCNDVVVTGRLRTIDSNPVEAEDDLIGHGVFTARLLVRKLLKGDEQRTNVIVRYTAHVPLRQDRDFLLVLSPASDGQYSLREAAVLGGGQKPSLAPSCSRTSE
jgi:hypothetical protein